MPVPYEKQLNETNEYGFQHPDNGAAMMLRVGEDGCPIVLVEDCELDDATPEEAAMLNKLAMGLTKAVKHMDDLYEAAGVLYREHHCKDIF